MKLPAIAAAVILGISSAALAQGGGGGGGGAGASGGAGGTGQSAAGAGGTGQSAAGAGGVGQTTGSGSQGNAFSDRGTNQSNNPNAPGTGGVDTPRRGVGTAPNGLPIGSSGSGPGSPEQPIDSGSR
jgi:hypothetical protein